MDTNTDLPTQFKTWVEFLDFANASDFKRTILFGVKLELIKDNALEELLSERYQKDEALEIFAKLRLMIFEQITPKNKMGEHLSKLKRIILTQSKKRHHE